MKFHTVMRLIILWCTVLAATAVTSIVVPDTPPESGQTSGLQGIISGVSSVPGAGNVITTTRVQTFSSSGRSSSVDTSGNSGGFPGLPGQILPGATPYFTTSSGSATGSQSGSLLGSLGQQAGGGGSYTVRRIIRNFTSSGGINFPDISQYAAGTPSQQTTITRRVVTSSSSGGGGVVFPDLAHQQTVTMRNISGGSQLSIGGKSVKLEGDRSAIPTQFPPPPNPTFKITKKRIVRKKIIRKVIRGGVEHTEEADADVSEEDDDYLRNMTSGHHYANGGQHYSGQTFREGMPGGNYSYRFFNYSGGASPWNRTYWINRHRQGVAGGGRDYSQQSWSHGQRPNFTGSGSWNDGGYNWTGGNPDFWSSSGQVLTEHNKASHRSNINYPQNLPPTSAGVGNGISKSITLVTSTTTPQPVWPNTAKQLPTSPPSTKTGEVGTGTGVHLETTTAGSKREFIPLPTVKWLVPTTAAPTTSTTLRTTTTSTTTSTTTTTTTVPTTTKTVGTTTKEPFSEFSDEFSSLESTEEGRVEGERRNLVPESSEEVEMINPTENKPGRPEKMDMDKLQGSSDMDAFQKATIIFLWVVMLLFIACMGLVAYYLLRKLKCCNRKAQGGSKHGDEDEKTQKLVHDTHRQKTGSQKYIRSYSDGSAAEEKVCPIPAKFTDSTVNLIGTPVAGVPLGGYAYGRSVSYASPASPTPTVPVVGMYQNVQSPYVNYGPVSEMYQTHQQGPGFSIGRSVPAVAPVFQYQPPVDFSNTYSIPTVATAFQQQQLPNSNNTCSIPTMVTAFQHQQVPTFSNTCSSPPVAAFQRQQAPDFSNICNAPMVATALQHQQVADFNSTCSIPTAATAFQHQQAPEYSNTCSVPMAAPACQRQQLPDFNSTCSRPPSKAPADKCVYNRSMSNAPNPHGSTLSLIGAPLAKIPEERFAYTRSISSANPTLDKHTAEMFQSGQLSDPGNKSGSLTLIQVKKQIIPSVHSANMESQNQSGRCENLPRMSNTMFASSESLNNNTACLKTSANSQNSGGPRQISGVKTGAECSSNNADGSRNMSRKYIADLSTDARNWSEACAKPQALKGAESTCGTSSGSSLRIGGENNGGSASNRCISNTNSRADLDNSCVKSGITKQDAGVSGGSSTCKNEAGSSSQPRSANIRSDLSAANSSDSSMTKSGAGVLTTVTKRIIKTAEPADEDLPTELRLMDEMDDYFKYIDED